LEVCTGQGADPTKFAVITYFDFVSEYESGKYTQLFCDDPAQEFANSVKDKTAHYNPRNPSIYNLDKKRWSASPFQARERNPLIRAEVFTLDWREFCSP
jgi:hypothetical protein